MRDIDYAYAVARIRCNEQKLLNAEKMEQLISADSFHEAWKRLSDLGYEIPKDADLSAVLRNEQEKAWQLLEEIAPDKSELEFLTVRNSFQNLKAALKCVVTGEPVDAYFTEPANVKPEVIREAVEERDFSLLPEEMQQVAAECYRILTETADGQLSDTLIDRRALETYLTYAERTGSDTLRRLADFTVAVSDIKIAYRCATTGKDAAFLDRALVPCVSLDIRELKESALSGREAITAYLSKTDYRDASQKLTESAVSFEKWCDDFLLQSVAGAKYTAFGFLPLAGYYLAKENEIKTVRIIMAAKESNLPVSMIRERVRMLYV